VQGEAPVQKEAQEYQGIDTQEHSTSEAAPERSVSSTEAQWSVDQDELFSLMRTTQAQSPKTSCSTPTKTTSARSLKISCSTPTRTTPLSTRRSDRGRPIGVFE
jgi:hypothetical protein